MRTRNKVVFLSLPKLSDHLICPLRALRSLFKAYPMSSETSLFQINTSQGSNPATVSNVRKTLKNIISWGSSQVFFTFHDFRRSGAMFAFNAHIPIQDIK